MDVGGPTHKQQGRLSKTILQYGLDIANPLHQTLEVMSWIWLSISLILSSSYQSGNQWLLGMALFQMFSRETPGPVKDMANLSPSNLVRFRHRFGHELEPSHFRFTRSFNLQAHLKQHYHYHPQIIFRRTISWCQCTLVVRSYKAVPMMNRQRVFLQQGHYLACWGIWRGVTKSRQVGP